MDVEKLIFAAHFCVLSPFLLVSVTTRSSFAAQTRHLPCLLFSNLSRKIKIILNVIQLLQLFALVFQRVHYDRDFKILFIR